MKELETVTIDSDELYSYFDYVLEMINHKNSFIRVRGFRLICYLAKWDKDNKINDNIDSILKELEDLNGTAVRQCLGNLNLILLEKPELSEIIENRISNLDVSKYKECIRELIKKVIQYLLDNIH